MVADTGGWLSGRKVLISPHAIERLDPEQRLKEVALTQQQIKDAPVVGTDKPVSRKQEVRYHDHCGYPCYWAGAGLWEVGAYPTAAGAFPPPAAATDRDVSRAAKTGRRVADPHLRSSAEMRGCDIEATDGSIGQIDDFLFDDRSWQIRFVVVDTGSWLPGRMVLVSPQWISELDWIEQRAKVKLPREAVRASPADQPRTQLSDEETQKVQRHFEGWQWVSPKGPDRGASRGSRCSNRITRPIEAPTPRLLMQGTVVTLVFLSLSRAGPPVCRCRLQRNPPPGRRSTRAP